MITEFIHQAVARYVSKSNINWLARHTSNSGCEACGSCYGLHSGAKRCGTSTCRYCGTIQCSSNGLGNGCCKVCFHGLLPGWSGSEGICRYNGCKAEAVARGIRGKRYVCRDHAAQQFGADYLGKRLADRDKEWALV